MPKESSPGWTRSVITVPVIAAQLLGTGLLPVLTSWVPGFKFRVQSMSFVAEVALAGAGGTQEFVLRKGGATGTAIVACNALLANDGAGEFDQTAVAAADMDDAYFRSDADTLTINRTAGGTAFTGGSGHLNVVIMSRPQAAL